jgi:NAD+ diphosphatase
LDLEHPLTGPADRLGLSRRDPAWFQALLTHPETRFTPLHELKVLVSDPTEPRARLLRREQLPSAPEQALSVTLLGMHREHTCVAIDLGRAEGLDAHGTLADLREIGGLMDPADAGLLAHARAMSYWHSRHRYCGSCGQPTRAEQSGHLRCCTACGTQQFPRVDPAVIVLVADEDRCLLGRQRRWETPMYSTLAGFVEPGETLEQAVAREVREESSVEVCDVRYLSCQPWPFPASLMIAFRARPATDSIVLADGELVDARWFTRDELSTGIRAGQLAISRRHSVAWSLIADWFDEGALGALAELQGGD